MLRLRPYKACDAETIVSWITDEVTFRRWCADRYDHYPISADDMNRYYSQFAYCDNHYEMTAYDESGIAGHMIMRFTDSEKKILHFGFIIVDAKRRGCGLGKQMVQSAVRYAFDMLAAEAITLVVFESNEPAFRCYRSLGFRESVPPKTERYEIDGKEWRATELTLTRPQASK